MPTSITIEGLAEIGINSIRCVCGHCAHGDDKNVVIEFNFQEQKVIYLCSKCKKENHMAFGKPKPPDYPRSRMN